MGAAMIIYRIRPDATQPGSSCITDVAARFHADDASARRASYSAPGTIRRELYLARNLLHVVVKVVAWDPPDVVLCQWLGGVDIDAGRDAAGPPQWKAKDKERAGPVRECYRVTRNLWSDTIIPRIMAQEDAWREACGVNGYGREGDDNDRDAVNVADAVYRLMADRFLAVRAVIESGAVVLVEECQSEAKA